MSPGWLATFLNMITIQTRVLTCRFLGIGSKYHEVILASTVSYRATEQYQRYPLFGILTPFGPVRFSICAVLEPDTLDWNHTKLKICSSQTKRPERDLCVPGTVILQFDLSVGHQVSRCNLLINAISCTALYARLRHPVSNNIARTTAFR